MCTFFLMLFVSYLVCRNSQEKKRKKCVFLFFCVCVPIIDAYSETTVLLTFFFLYTCIFLQ